MYKKIMTKHYLLLSMLLFTAIFLPLIHSNAFRYTFIEAKFAFYDIVTSSITLYYFYYKKEFQLSYLSLFSLFFYSSCLSQFFKVRISFILLN